jgi:hypothetical protein
MIVLCLTTPEDRRDLLDLYSAWQLRECRSLREVFDLSRGSDVGAAVVDLDFIRGGSPEALLAELPNRIPLVLRTSIDSWSSNAVVRLSSRLSGPVRLSLRNVDELHSDLREAMKRPSMRGSELHIIAAVAPRLVGGNSTIVVGAAVAGKRRTQVQWFAHLIRVPKRTIEWRLQKAGWPPARELLAWMTSLHTLWRIDVLGWSLKQSASAADFHSSGQLSSYVKSHVGVGLKALRDAGGFLSLLSRFASLAGSVAAVPSAAQRVFPTLETDNAP